MTNVKEKADMIRAMDLIARSCNDERIVINKWFACGIADGDCESMDDYALVDSYAYDEESFNDLANYFLYIMGIAKENGGLYC